MLGRSIGLGTLILVLALLRSSPASALTACSAEGIIAQEPGCPAGDGVCIISSSFDTDDDFGCDYDFGARPVVLRGKLQVNSTLYLECGSLTLEPGSLLRAGDIEIDATGDVWIQRQDHNTRGLIDASGEGHYVAVYARSLRVDGDIFADATTAARDHYGIDITVKEGIVVGADSQISASDIAANPEGEFTSPLVRMESDGPIVLDGLIRILGAGDEGGLEVTSNQGSAAIGGRVRLDGWFAETDGGWFYVWAATGISLTAKVTTVAGPTTLASGRPGPWSGSVGLSGSDGDVVVSGEIITDGVLFGSAGGVDIGDDGANIIVSGSISAHSHRLHEEAAYVSVRGQAIDFSGDLNIDNGASVSFAAEQIDLSGDISGHISAGEDFGEHEPQIYIQLAQQLHIGGHIDLSASGCEKGVCAPPWTVDLSTGERIEIAPGAEIRNVGRVGGSIELGTANLDVAGKIDAHGDSADGSVELKATTSCSVSGPIAPLPMLVGACAPSFTPPPTPTASATITGAAVATATPTSTRTSTPVTTMATATATRPPCAGDCDGSGTVDAVDLVRLLDVIHACPDSLSSCEIFSPEEACLSADLDRDDRISASELTRILSSMQAGESCP